MLLKDYLKKCSVNTVDELSDQQVIAFYECPDIYIGQKWAVRDALRFGEKRGFSKEAIMSSIRKSLKTGADFGITYITGESAFGPSDVEEGWIMEPYIYIYIYKM